MVNSNVNFGKNYDIFGRIPVIMATCPSPLWTPQVVASVEGR